MNAVLCLPSIFENVFKHILQSYNCRCCTLRDLNRGFPGVEELNGFFLVWAEEFRTMGAEEAISWFTCLRIEKAHRWHRWPIIIIGYSSHLAFLRTLSVPRILASPGVEYIQLPCDSKRLLQKIERAIEPSEDMIKCYVQDHDQTKRMSDRLAHDLGNYYAMFRLLDGAYKDGALNQVDYLTILDYLKEIQDKESILSDQISYKVFRFLRGSVVSPGDPTSPPDSTKPIVQDEAVLLIDDAASLGWAQSLAMVLYGNTKKELESKRIGSMQKLQFGKFTCLCSDKPLDKFNENNFFSELKKFFGSKEGKILINSIDLIFLDLRLRRTTDEGLLPDQFSGVEMLQAIRRINKGVPIIAFTSSKKIISRDIVSQYGADEYFEKNEGFGGENPDSIKAYYKKFKKNVESMLQRSYLKEIWKGMENIRSVSNDCRNHLKQAFALIRHPSNKFEEENFFYSPYFAAIVELFSAIEKHFKIHGSMDYREEIAKVIHQEPLLSYALYIRNVRNLSAHAREMGMITEKDTRIAFGWVLCLFKSEGYSISSVLGVDPIIANGSTGKETVRKLFSFLRKKVNSLKIEDLPSFKSSSNLEKVFDKELSYAYVSYILRPAFSEIPNYEDPTNIYFLNATLERLMALESISIDSLAPTYDRETESTPRIVEAFWSNDRSRWYAKDGTQISKSNIPGGCSPRRDHTRAFLIRENKLYEPWGPPIPFGYEEDELKKRLGVPSGIW